MKYEFNRTLEIVDTKLFVKVEFEFGVEYQAKEGGEWSCVLTSRLTPC